MVLSRILQLWLGFQVSDNHLDLLPYNLYNYSDQ